MGVASVKGNLALSWGLREGAYCVAVGGRWGPRGWGLRHAGHSVSHCPRGLWGRTTCSENFEDDR